MVWGIVPFSCAIEMPVSDVENLGKGEGRRIHAIGDGRTRRRRYKSHFGWPYGHCGRRICGPENERGGWQQEICASRHAEGFIHWFDGFAIPLQRGAHNQKPWRQDCFVRA